MTTITVDVGAPPSGGGATDPMASFAAAKFPLRAVITNHMPRDITLAEVRDAAGEHLFLRHCAASTGAVQEADLINIEQVTRLVSTITQIAALNRYDRAVTIAFDPPTPAPAPAKKVTS